MTSIEMNSVLSALLLLLFSSSCIDFIEAELLSLPSIDSMTSQGTSTYMEHHSNTPQFDRQYDTAPTAYSSGGYEGHTPADPPGYAIQEGYEGFLIPMKTGAVTGLTIALSIVSVLLGLLSAAVFKLPVLTLLLLKIKKLIKLDLIKQRLKKKPVGRQLIDDDHIADLTRLIFSAIDRLDQLNQHQTST